MVSHRMRMPYGALYAVTRACYKQTMTYNVSLFVAIGALGFVLSGASHAQLGNPAPLPQIKKATGPSLEETTQWITQKVASFPAHIARMDGGVSVDRKNEVNFDSCTMNISERLKTTNSRLADYVVTPVNLHSLSTEMSVSKEWGPDPWYFLSAKTADGQRTVRQLEATSLDVRLEARYPKIMMGLLNDNAGDQTQSRQFSADGVDLRYTIKRNSTAHFFVPDIEVGERLMNALKHAVTLCQQKDLENKAGRPPRPKELF